MSHPSSVKRAYDAVRRKVDRGMRARRAYGGLGRPLSSQPIASRPSWRRWDGRFAGSQPSKAGGRSRGLSNFAPDRLGWRGWAAGQGGNGAEFPFFKLAAGCTSLTTFSGSSPSSTTGLRAISAHILFPPLATCYARHGVDRPAGRYAGLHSRFHVPSVQHGSATMLKPMIDIPLASLRCPPEALPGRLETADTVAAA